MIHFEGEESRIIISFCASYCHNIRADEVNTNRVAVNPPRPLTHLCNPTFFFKVLTLNPLSYFINAPLMIEVTIFSVLFAFSVISLRLRPLQRTLTNKILPALLTLDSIVKSYHSRLLMFLAAGILSVLDQQEDLMQLLVLQEI